MTTAERHALWRERRLGIVRDDPLGTGLTERQREMLRLVMHGYTDARIVAGMGISHSVLKVDLGAAADTIHGDGAQAIRTRLAVWLFAREFPRAIGASAIRAPAPATPAEPEDRLTDRDREILRRIAEGQGNAEIARHLDIAIHTLKNRLTIVFSLIGVGGVASPRAAAAAWWVRHAGDIPHSPASPHPD